MVTGETHPDADQKTIGGLLLVFRNISPMGVWYFPSINVGILAVLSPHGRKMPLPTQKRLWEPPRFEFGLVLMGF